MKKQSPLLLSIWLFLFSTITFAQSPQYNWRWHPITKITKQPGTILVECKLDMFYADRTKLFEDAIKQINSRLPAEKKDEFDDSPKKTIIPSKFQEKLLIGNNDSLTVYTRSTDKKKEENLRFKIISTTIGKDVYDYNITYEIATTATDKTFALKDLLALKVRQLNIDSLLLYRIDNANIQFLSSANVLIFPEQLRFYDQLEEMSVIKMLLSDMKDAAEYFKTKITAPFITSGPYAGKTFPEILNAATEKDVIDFLNAMATYSRSYLGNDYKFIEVYLGWISNQQYPGKLKNLKIVEEYDKLVKAGPMKIDLLKGTINGIALKVAMDNWLSYFPNYNGTEQADRIKTKPYYEYYNITGNFIKYYIGDRKIRVGNSAHRWFSGDSYSDFTLQEVEKKLGKPTLILGKGADQIYLYDRPYGTLIIPFTGEYGEPGAPTVACVFMSLKKPAAITLDSFK